MMVQTTTRLLLALTVVALLPIFGTPTASAGHLDDCVAGIDASDWRGDPTDLVVTEGCKGSLYRPPDNNGNHHEADYYDAYQLLSKEGKPLSVSWTTFQICNLGSYGILYEVWWQSEGFGFERAAVDWLDPGECSSEEPESIKGRSHPGRWVYTVEAFPEITPNNTKIPYYLYAVVY